MALSMDPAWGTVSSRYRFETRQVNDGKVDKPVAIYHIKDQTIPMKLTFIQVYYHEVIKIVGEKLRVAKETAACKGAPKLGIKFDMHIENLQKKWVTEFNASTNSMKALEQKTGLKKENYLTVLKEVTPDIKEIFGSVRSQFDFNEIDKMNEEWTTTIESQIVTVLWPRYGLQPIQDQPCFTLAELDPLEIDLSLCRSPNKMDCGAYLFYKFKDLSLKDWIFFGKTPVEYFKEPFKALSKNYSIVTCPKYGDGVVFLNDKGEATHYARYLEAGRVESKIGDKPVCQHLLENALGQYSSQFAFFRQKDASHS